MALVLDLLDGVLLGAPGVPEPLAANYYVRAAREFFTETLAHRAQVAAAQGGDTGTYTLAVPADTEAFDATKVILSGQPLRKAAHSQVLRANPGRQGGEPQRYRISAGNLTLDPAPDAGVADLLYVLAVVRPTRTATTLDDAMAAEFADIIEQGALAKILMIGNKPWTDTGTASAMYQLFQADIDRWRSKARDDGMTGVARTVRYGGY